ncbi:MAG TPA: ABC transporter ATP-binding protein/permease [Dongiaceae bacterium]|jgi:putative ABC transport system ATP-binding protein
MERNLFKYIWHHSWRDQLAILAVVLISKLFYLVSLDLPKEIVNDGIRGDAFKKAKVDELPFMHLTLGPYEWLGMPKVTLLDGIALNQMDYLFALCFAYLFFVVANGWMKQRILIDKGRLGERMLRRLRYQLFDRVLRFPIHYFRKVKQAEVATMIKDEVDPIGGFIGEAYITPADLIGTALTALYFLFTQSVFLGGITVLILLIQLVVIPRLRRKILQLGRQRQVTARALAGRIAEVVDGAQDVHVHDTSNYERADIVHRLGIIFKIRFDLYQRKFFVKYLNNMLAQTTPFLFYLIGGYLALKGQFDTGSLLASIVAYKDVPSPIKELIDWDQQRQDVQIKYDQVMEQFNPDGMLASELQHPEAEMDVEPASLVLNHVVLNDESGARLVDEVTLEMPTGTHMAVIGNGASGKDYLGLLLGRLVRPTSGQLRYGEHDLMLLPEAVTGRRFSYVGEESFLFPLALRENLTYGLKHRPVAPALYEGESQTEYERRVREAIRAGNPPLDPLADWLDLSGAGVPDRPALKARILELLSDAEFDDDVYQFGLRGRVDPARDTGLSVEFLKARATLRERLASSDARAGTSMAALVEPFDPARYNQNMTLVENLLFGTAVGHAFAPENLTSNEYLIKVLRSTKLGDSLVEMGRKIAETMVEIFADLPAGHPFFEQYSFIAAEDLPAYRELIQRDAKTPIAAINPKDRLRFVALTFPYIEARHRLDLIDGAMEERLLEGRRAFAATLPEDLAKSIEFYDPETYNTQASVQDNILFGRLVYGQAQAAQKVGRVIAEVIDGLGLRPRVIEVGLDYNVGAGGKRLSAAQRQKAALVRALVKRPQLLILNNALAVFDDQSQRRLVTRIRGIMAGADLILISDNAGLARMLDRVVVMKEGRVVEQGSVGELDRDGSRFRELAGQKVAVAA